MRRLWLWLAGSTGTVVAAAICLVIALIPVAGAGYLVVARLAYSDDRCPLLTGPPWADDRDLLTATEGELRWIPFRHTCVWSDGSVYEVTLSGSGWHRPPVGQGTR